MTSKSTGLNDERTVLTVNGLPKRPRVKDVAELAGVSVGTVSNVLNSRSSVRPEVRNSVEAAITELGFVRNTAAQALRTGLSPFVGVAVLDLTNPFFMEAAAGMEERLNNEGCLMALASTNSEADNEAHLLRSFAAQRVRGVLLTPTDSSLTTAHEIVRQGIPVVLFDSPATPPNMSSVSVNDQKGAELAIEHLLSLGHHRILFLNGPSHVRQAQDRHLGVNRAIKLASQNWQHTISPIELTEISLASFTANAARSELQELIVGSKLQIDSPTQPAPTAIFCANDLIAIGAMTALQASGIRIPEDVSLVGFDDISLAQQTSVSLTTVRQPMKELGWAAADLLLNSQSPSAPKNIEHKSFTPEVIVRDSTAEASASQ